MLSLQLSGLGTQAETLGPAAESSFAEEVLEAPQKGQVVGERREHRRPSEKRAVRVSTIINRI